jgi:hypothetical protein
MLLVLGGFWTHITLQSRLRRYGGVAISRCLAVLLVAALAIRASGGYSCEGVSHCVCPQVNRMVEAGGREERSCISHGRGVERGCRVSLFDLKALQKNVFRAANFRMA